MQFEASIGTQANNIACIRRDLWLIEDYIEHNFLFSPSSPVLSH